MPNLANRRTGSLSGPDTTGNEPAKQTIANNQLQINTSLSGRAAMLRIVNPVRLAHIGPDTGIPTRPVLNTGLRPTVTGDSDYYFRNTMSEELLHKYLDRALTMQNLSVSPGNLIAPDDIERSEDMAMIQDLKPKMILAMVGLYGDNDITNINDVCAQLRTDIDTIHSFDPDVICQAVMLERISDPNTNTVPIPSSVIRVYNDEIIEALQNRSIGTYPGPYFSYNNIVYSHPDAISYGASEGTPDINRVEARMWFYYLATRYIDSGCEALQFGDIFTMNKVEDPGTPDPGVGTLFTGTGRYFGNKSYWTLTQKIRAYAVGKNRGLVLCETHVPAPRVDFAYYYDPSGPILPNWERQLIFDYNSCESNFSLPPTGSPLLCRPGYYPGLLTADHSLLTHNLGGKHPQGWYCKHNAGLLNLDNSTSAAGGGGCDMSWDYFYGYDETSWFAYQYPDALRDSILKYIVYQVKCLDPYTHFSLPGRFVIIPDNNYLNDTVYRANSAPSNSALWPKVYRQQQTIKDIWNDVFVGPFDWADHNFTTENVGSGADVASSLIFVGTDQIYYIADSGYINAYIRVDNSTYNGGTWLTTSPSYACQLPVSAQVKAKSDLVASPDGQTLLYIGVDGYIHGFTIVNVWTYSYFDFMVPDMRSYGARAVSNLIISGNDSVYFIGATIEVFNILGKKLIFGFQKISGSWQTNNPSYSANETGVVFMNIANQLEAAGGLAIENEYQRLYYRTTEGYLAYFDIIRSVSLIEYRYDICDYNYQLQAQHVTVVGNLAIYGNRIYFVGLYAGTYYIYCIIDNGGSWNGVSPSWSADIYNHQPINSQIQSDPRGEIAVSPDGNTISYFGRSPDLYLCYYKNIDGVNYSFSQNRDSFISVGDNSLQFINTADMFYVCTDKMVHHFKYEEAFCENPLTLYPEYMP